MPLLFYWRPDHYRHDLVHGLGYHLNQDAPVMGQVEPGDSVWAFTRAGGGDYALAAELVVRAKTRNSPRYRYGAWRVWGDLERSRYFRVEGQPRVEQVLRALSLRPKPGPLGQSFQGRAGVRRITAADHELLKATAAGLALEPRARLQPEELLEAQALLGAELAPRFLQEEAPGLDARRRAWLYDEVLVRRSRELVERLRATYRGRCQVCAWTPRDHYGVELCESHHLHWISRGGPDELFNLTLLCPNHHRAVHRCDAAFDYADLAFVFPDHREALVLNEHLERAA